MASENWVLTPEERNLINEVYSKNLLDEAGWARFYERVRTSPKREGAIESALMDEGLGSRVSREARGIHIGLSDPNVGIEAAREHFEQHGVAGGLGEIAKSAVTTPFRAIGSIGSGQGLGEKPLSTAVGALSIVPVGRLVGGALGAGARAAATRGISSAVLNSARVAGRDAARAAAAAGSSADDAIRAGLEAANRVVSEANPGAASTFQTGQAVSRAASSPLFTHLARGVEAGDILTGIEEWPLELIGEGMLDIGASVAARYGRTLFDSVRDDLSADGPPPDAPPQQPTAAIGGPPPTQPTAPTQPQPEPAPTAPVEPEPAPTQPEPTPDGVPPVISPLWQTENGDPVAPKTPGANQTHQNTRKYSVGDSSDPASVSTLTVKRVPNPNGKMDNKHWQAWYSGGGLDSVSEAAPLSFGPDDNVGSFDAARDAALGQVPDIRTGGIQTSRQEREERADVRRQERAERRQPAESEPTPPVETQTDVEEPVEDEPEFDDDELTEQLARNTAMWVMENEEMGEDLQDTVEEVIYQGYQDGFVRDQEHGKQLAPRVLERTKTMIPELETQMQEEAAARQAFQESVETAVSGIKFEKSTLSIATREGKQDIEGYNVTDTGLGIDLAIHRPLGKKSNWVAIEAKTGMIVGIEQSTREEAVRDAVTRILNMGVEQMQANIAQHLGETPPEETPDEPAQETPRTDDTDALPAGVIDELATRAAAAIKAERLDLADLDPFIGQFINQALQEGIITEDQADATFEALANRIYEQLSEETPDEPEQETQPADETPETSTWTDEPPPTDEIPDTERDIPRPASTTEITPEAIVTQVENQLQENPEADVRAILNIIFDNLVTSGTVSEAESYPLRDRVEEILEATDEQVDSDTGRGADPGLGDDQRTPAPQETQQTPQETQETQEPVGAGDTALADIIEVTGFADDATNEDKLIFAISRYLRSSNQPLTATQLFAGATAAYGPDYNSQTVYDVMEVAGNDFIEKQGLMDVNVDAAGAIANIQAIQAVEARLPRQADRTAEREQNQQYSTPFHYAYVVNWVANLTESDVVLEPSAGTGNLAWYAKHAGADVHVNDIGKVRFRLLKQYFFEATNVDARQIDKRLANVQPTLVVMNPPFSQTEGQKKNTLLGVNMVEAALKSLQPGGRLVAIVNGGRDLTDQMIAGETPGGGPNFNAKDYRKWWNRIVNNYQVRANVHVNGQVYSQFGTTFNTRLLVIDKRSGGEVVYPLRNQDGSLKTEYEVMHKQRVDTLAEIPELLQSVRQMRTRSVEDARTPEDEQQPSEPTGEAPIDETRRTRPVPDQEPEPRTDVSTTPPEPEPPTDDVPADPDAVVSRRTRGAVSPSEPTDVDGESGDTEGGTPNRGVEMAGLGTEPRDTADTRPDTGGSVGDRDVGDTTVRPETGGGGDFSPQSAEAVAGRDSQAIDDPPDASKVWVPAQDSHIVKGRQVNLQETVSLATIRSPEVGNVAIDIPAEFLDRYSEAQKRSIRLALRAHESFIQPEIVGDSPPRQGFYNGDDTGVGKTWEAAGVFIHNQRQGRKKNIFVTATQDLIKDFQEAYPIAGGDAEKTFNITDGLKKDGILISTYSTLGGQNLDPTRISEILEWATGEKPPESILNPRTDTELLMFGELPKTMELAYNMWKAGDAMPSRVVEVLEKLDQFQVNVSRAGEHWTEQYQDILNESDALREAEGGTTPAQWTEQAKKFDGVIVFDEAHKMKKSRGRGASSTGIRGTQLARLLPNARVVYMSATGTTEIGNMAYMERLGIWGRDKPFANAEDFISEMERGGIASQEVVARDLKAKGLFLSRSLDFSDVVVRSLVHELSPEQEQTYNELANVWQEIRLFLFNYIQTIKDLVEEAEDGAANAGDVAGDIWGQYYSKQQVFFQAMLDAMKMQSVVPDMMAQLDQGKKVTLQIVNTYEANQNRQEQRAQRGGIDMGEVELSAREILEDYLHEETGVLPIYDYEVILDAETGENMLRKITNDTDETMVMSNGMQVPPGAPIPNMENLARREALLDLTFKSYLPPSPLDQFVQAFKSRGIEIAESTGRSTRYFLDESGERVKEELAPKRARADVKQFNENKLFGLAFSKKGATGANYPSTDPNHPIVQYVIQVGWQADDFKQGLGRSKRANEVAPPEIVTTATNMVGELRFQSTAASRAAELGATTRGQAQEGTGLDLFSFDAKYLNTDYGKNALYNLIYDLYTGSVIPVPGEVDANGRPLIIGWNTGEGITSFLEVTGIDVAIDEQTGRPKTERFPSVNRFMNRVLGAPSIALQNALYDAFFSRMSGALEEARADGTLDTGIDTLNTESASIREDYVLYTDEDTGAETYATLLEIEEKTEVLGWNDVLSQIDSAQRIGKEAAFYLKEDGGVSLDIDTSTRTNDHGQVIQRLRRVNPEGRTRYMDATTAYPENAGMRIPVAGISESDLADVQADWDSELAGVPLTKKSNIMLVRGLMIDVWDKINEPITQSDAFTSDRRTAEQIAARKLVRVITDEGQNIIGRRFTDRADFQRMLQAFGKDPESMSAVKQRVTGRDVQRMMDDDGFTIELSNGFRVRQRTRAGQPYYAVEGPQSTLEGLVNDRVLEKFRPSGGAMTYSLPISQANAFLERYPPVAAIKGNQRIELEYTHPDLPTPPPDDDPDTGGEGGEGGTDTGGTLPPPNVPPVRSEASETVQENDDTTQTPRSTGTPSTTRSPGQPPRERIRDRIERQQAETEQAEQAGLSDEDKIEMVIDKVSGWILDDIKAGKNGDESFEDQTRDGIWHGVELYELDYFEGESPEAVRDFMRQEIITRVNQEGLMHGGRHFIMLKQAEPLATPEVEPDTDDPVELLKRIQNAEPQQTEDQSGTLTFSLGSQVTAEIKKGNYDTQKSAIVRFYVADTAQPIESHYRGKSLSPKNIVDTLSKQITPFEIRTALGQPTTVDGITYTPDTFQIHINNVGMVDAEGLRLSGTGIDDYAELVVHPQYQANKKTNEKQFSTKIWQVTDIKTGLGVPGGSATSYTEATQKGVATIAKLGKERYTEIVNNVLAERGGTPTTPPVEETVESKIEGFDVKTSTDKFGTSIVLTPDRSSATPMESVVSENREAAEIIQSETQVYNEREKLTGDGYKQTSKRSILHVDRGYGEQQSDVLFYVQKPDGTDKTAIWTINVRKNQESVALIGVPRQGGIRPNQKVIKNAEDALIKLMRSVETQLQGETPSTTNDAIRERARSEFGVVTETVTGDFTRIETGKVDLQIDQQFEDIMEDLEVANREGLRSWFTPEGLEQYGSRMIQVLERENVPYEIKKATQLEVLYEDEYQVAEMASFEKFLSTYDSPTPNRGGTPNDNDISQRETGDAPSAEVGGSVNESTGNRGATQTPDQETFDRDTFDDAAIQAIEAGRIEKKSDTLYSVEVAGYGQADFHLDGDNNRGVTIMIGDKGVSSMRIPEEFRDLDVGEMLINNLRYHQERRQSATPTETRIVTKRYDKIVDADGNLRYVERPQETPDSSTTEEKVSIPAPSNVEEILSPDLARQRAALVAEARRNAPEAKESLKNDLKAGVLHAIENKLYKKVDVETEWNAYRTKYEGIQGLIEFHANTNNSIVIIPTLPTVFKPFEVEASADVVKSITTKAQRAIFKKWETPDEPTNVSGSQETTETPTPGEDTTTPTPVSTTPPASDSTDTTTGGDSGDTDTEYVYYGATFTEAKGKLSITGDDIPESFWNFYHSGGRGRNSAHKRAMKEAGWEYTFRGRPRIYTFSITVANFNKWKAANPDDGSAPVDIGDQGTDAQKALMNSLREAEIEVVITDHGSPWRDDAHHFVFEGVDDIKATAIRAWNKQRNAKAYEVTVWGTDTLNHVKQRVEWRDVSGVDDTNYSHHDKKKEAIKVALTKIDPSQFVQKTPRTEPPPVPDAPETLKTQAIAELEAGNFETNGWRYNITLPELGKVEVSVSSRQVSSYGGGGMSEPKTETDMSFVSMEDPRRFKFTTIDVPDSVREKYETKFRNDFINDFANPKNWERIGRRNAFKNITNGATLTIRKGRYEYEGNFEDIPEYGKLSVRMDGEGLWERFANALSAVEPYQFRHNDVGIMIDTLKLETQGATDETSESGDTTPDEIGSSVPAGIEGDAPDTTGDISSSAEKEIATALETLGMMAYDEYSQLTPAQQGTAIEQAYDKALEASGDFSLTKEQTDAVNLLQARANKWERETTYRQVSGGAPLTQTLETVLAVPDIPEPNITKSSRHLKMPPGTLLEEKVDGLTPKMRLWLERSRREYMSGYKNLSTLGAVGEALRVAAEYVLDIQDRGSVVDLRQLQPHQKALMDLAKRRTLKGQSQKVVHSNLSKQIFTFMEENLPIVDAELQEIAEGWKEAWRKILASHTHYMLQLRREVESLPGNERLVIRSSSGQPRRDWSPMLPEHEWIDDEMKFKRDSDGAMLTADEAIAAADKLHMPHSYPKSHWNEIVDKVQVNSVIKRLDAALKSKKILKIPDFDYDKATKSWTFRRTGDTFTSKEDAVRAAKAYWTEQFALAQEMLAGKEKSVIGRYGHLEVERSTNDKLYMRDVSMLLEHVQMFWRRVGEIAAWGQDDPILGRGPRLAQYIAKVRETPRNLREKALMAVSRTLLEDESDMFEKLPSFREGEDTAANIMQHWNTPDIQRLRDENPDIFTDEIMQELVDVGMVERVGDTYQLKGEDDDAQRSTFIRHLVPFYQTLYLREEAVMKIVRGIGHWDQSDILNSNSARTWSAINHLTTTMTLGLSTSLQNMAEVPLLATVAGSKVTATGLQRLAADEEFRRFVPMLGGAMTKAIDYLADTDTQAKYLNISLFTPTERWSRMAGVAVGWYAAIDAITNYLADPSRKNRVRLEELNISVETIDNYKLIQSTGEAPDFPTLIKEAESRVLEGAMMISGLRRPDADPPSNIHVDYVGDEMARAARYVSVQVFKGYNALSLPNFLTKSDPLIRTFFKFKSWAAQMHQFMWKQFGNAQREARQGNWQPAWRLAQGLIAMGISTSALIALLAFMSGKTSDEDEDALTSLILKPVAMSQTLGLASMIMELAIYADGNPYRASQLISSAFGSPTAGVLARVGSNLLAGDPGEAASTTFWQLPGARELRRFGGGALKAVRGEE